MPRKRCQWVVDDPLYLDFHDLEWGVPVHDDLRLFEFLILEGAQAGLSWRTILNKRENYRSAFAGFRGPGVEVPLAFERGCLLLPVPHLVGEQRQHYCADNNEIQCGKYVLPLDTRHQIVQCAPQS